MILSDIEVSSRLESPLNLINRLQKLSTPKDNPMDIFVPVEVTGGSYGYIEPWNKDKSEPQSFSDESIQSILASITDDKVEDLDEVIPDNAAKIKLGIVKAKALDVLHDSLVYLGNNLSQVRKVERLSTIARDMKSILRDDEDNKKGNTNVIVYKPITNEITKYDTIVVSE